MAPEISKVLKPTRISHAICVVAILTAIGSGWIWLRGRTQAYHAVALPIEPALVVPQGAHSRYTTSFPEGESPLFEKGKWITGAAVGLDWEDVNSAPGLAYGTESGTGQGDKAYDDSTALLTGEWAADQTVAAEVRSVKPNDYDFEEVELRLRSSLAAHHATGYEVLFRCSKTDNAYASIVRWNGPVGSFTYLSQKKGRQFGVADGDIVQAKAVGNVITGYINGVEVIQATDNTYIKGNPGMGFWFKKSSSKKFWLLKSKNATTDCGFRRFAAWD